MAAPPAWRLVSPRNKADAQPRREVSDIRKVRKGNKQLMLLASATNVLGSRARPGLGSRVPEAS